ncbi:hypothetical protein ACFXPS_41905 [Nocardia sp. NPDC059091]|uniref:hypothetical protein n=1 Tax=unclassified Nocardia TaxID=2637762 RepID=UPI0036AB528E
MPHTQAFIADRMRLQVTRARTAPSVISHGSTVAIRLKAATTVIFLDLPAVTCLVGILQRRWRYRGGHLALNLATSMYRSRPPVPRSRSRCPATTRSLPGSGCLATIDEFTARLGTAA